MQAKTHPWIQHTCPTHLHRDVRDGGQLQPQANHRADMRQHMASTQHTHDKVDCWGAADVALTDLLQPGLQQHDISCIILVDTKMTKPATQPTYDEVRQQQARTAPFQCLQALHNKTRGVLLHAPACTGHTSCGSPVAPQEQGRTW